MSRQLQIWVGEQLVGHLGESDDIWVLEYDCAWVNASNGFDLSPSLPRSQLKHIDGATQRPVQWYFDNLLPEETLRGVLAQEAQLDAADAFGLLAYFGAESAGSLVLRLPQANESAPLGLRGLPLSELNQRILNLPRASLTKDAPKRMSLAGAQHKMVVVCRDGRLYEPLPGEASTHILKPNHLSEHYPASVMNEFFCMSLARRVGLNVPDVQRFYVPQPVYVVERFDRSVASDQSVQRLHAIDTCQLLGQSKAFKYASANLETLNQALELCREKALARLQLYQWLVFNVLVGNGDNHLKNISFLVSAFGVSVAPAYDLLSTAVYATRALADENARWPQVDLAFAIGSAASFAAITRAHMLAAGCALGLSEQTACMELDRLLAALPIEAVALRAEIAQNFDAAIAQSPDSSQAALHQAGELRVIDSIVLIVLRDMVQGLR